MGWLCFFFFAALAVPAIVKGLIQAAKNKESAELRQKDPELWLRAKQIEHEERLMEHQKRVTSHNGIRTGIGIGAFILRILMKG